MYFYELSEADDEIFANVLLGHDAEYDEQEYLEIVQEARENVLKTFEEDSLIEAIATELEKRHGFVHIEASLRASVRVSAEEGETVITPVDERRPSRRPKRTTSDRCSSRPRPRTAPTATTDRAGAERGQTLKSTSRVSPSLTRYVLPSERSLPRLARLGHGAERDQVLVGHDLGADEAARQVGVDRRRRIDGG